MPPNRDQLRIEEAIDEALKASLTQMERELVELWAQAWDRLRPEVEASMLALADAKAGGRVTAADVRRDARMQAALAALYGALADIADRAPGIASSVLTAVATEAADGHADIIQAGLSGVLRTELRSSVVAADPGQVAAIIERTRERITAQSYALADEAQAAIRRDITSGILVGDNPRAAARTAVRGIEDRWNGGIARASTIARTEMIDAHRTAAARTHRANADVIAGWTWSTHLDERTCRACLGMHGTTHGLDEPGPLGHPNCRCARLPETKSWEELGFPGMRDAKSALPDMDGWFRKLPESEQRDILTDKGYERWKAGNWPRSEWASRRENSGWRDSYQPARP